MARHKSVMGLVFLLLSVSTPYGQEAASIYDKVYNRAELPSSGEFVNHPKKKATVYYYTNRLRMWGAGSNASKHPGLYLSTNGGETWKLLCYFFDFKTLFIHPETEKLYAIIKYEWLANNEKGVLVPHSADKALASVDGKQWKDIMGKQKYMTEIHAIFQDPDNSHRVCLKASTIRGYVLQSADDDYTQWEWYRDWDWPKRQEIKASRKQ